MQTRQIRANQKGLLMVAIALILLAVGMFGTMFYLQRRADAPVALIRTSVDAVGPPILTPQEKQALRDKAVSLREHWRVWALQNKDLLQRLMHASADDQETLMQAYNAIPAHPTRDNAGLDSADVSSLPWAYTWDAGTKEQKLHPQHSSDPRAERLLRSEVTVADKRLQSDFAARRDIEICMSMNFGDVGYFVFASGRVIEEMRRSRDAQGHPLAFPTEREIEPPYDFLQ